MKLPSNLNRLFAPPQGAEEDAYTGALLKNIYKAELNISVVRCIALLANTISYLLAGNNALKPEVAYTIVAATWAYALLMLLAHPYKIYGFVLSAPFACLADAAIIVAWVYLGGGVVSSYYLLMYFAVAAIAYKYNAKTTILSGIFFALCYIAVLLVMKQLYTNVLLVSERCTYIFIVGGVVACIPTAGAGHTRVDGLLHGLQERLAETEMEIREREDAINGLNNVLEERVKRRAQEYEAIANRYKELADTLPFAAWIMNATGLPEYNNRQYRALVGDNNFYDPASIVHPHDAEKATAAWEHAKKTGTAYTMEQRWITVTGAYICMLVHVAPTRDEKGQVTGWMGTAADITEQKKISEQKDRFVGIASAELKAPVGSIRSYTQLVSGALENNEHEAARIFIKKTGSYLDSMEHTISNMLDVIRMRGNRMAYDMAVFDFSELLEECVNGNRHTGKKHRLFLLRNEHVKINGDRHWLKEAIDVLMGSIINHTTGHTDIFIRAEKDKSALTVTLTCKGMEGLMEKLGAILGHNRNLPDDEEMPQGLGLGFFIAKEVIQQHQGAIWAESEEGKDTAFYFTLPVMS